MEEPLSRNGYTYVHNNPVNFIDPSGHIAMSPNGFMHNSYMDRHIGLPTPKPAPKYTSTSPLDYYKVERDTRLFNSTAKKRNKTAIRQGDGSSVSPSFSMEQL